MIKNNPLFGIGPGNFQEKYLEYQEYFPPYLEWAVPQPHNLYLAFWLESGLVGLTGFIWIIFLFFKDNKNAIRENREIGILFLEIMIYILVHGMVDTTYWRNDLALVFWAVMVMNFCLSKSLAKII
jgi:O-antigen ligase